MGQYLRVTGGQVEREEGRGCPAGTVVTVENLFYNVPARLKFLRTPKTETGHIHDVISHYAMAFPGIRFTPAGRQPPELSSPAATASCTTS